MITGVGPAVAASALVLVVVAVAGCGSNSPSALDRPAAPSRSSTLIVDDSANGTAVIAHVGDRIRVVLGGRQETGSTYWRFAPLTGQVVSGVQAPVTHGSSPGSPAGCGIAGAGCGTVTWTIDATSPGIATITAHRITCGEALRCPADEQDFQVQIQVLPG
jgi:hypothetical protein